MFVGGFAYDVSCKDNVPDGVTVLSVLGKLDGYDTGEPWINLTEDGKVEKSESECKEGPYVMNVFNVFVPVKIGRERTELNCSKDIVRECNTVLVR